MLVYNTHWLYASDQGDPQVRKSGMGTHEATYGSTPASQPDCPCILPSLSVEVRDLELLQRETEGAEQLYGCHCYIQVWRAEHL